MKKSILKRFVDFASNNLVALSFITGMTFIVINLLTTNYYSGDIYYIMKII